MDIQISKYTKDKAKIMIDVSLNEVENIVKLLMKIDSGTITSGVIHEKRKYTKKKYNIATEVKKKKLTPQESGLLGAKARIKNQSAKRRSEIAKNAVAKRWSNARSKAEAEMSKSLNGKHLTVNDLYSIED